MEKETSRLEEEIEALKSRVDECEEEMKKLKVVLYGKFGSNISEYWGEGVGQGERTGGTAG